ncbi:potassium channel family protein [Anoxynatronum buryatiense]|uniref:Trk system potassium uptake protein TrkA n=1 Tax=Anoxynatronum buryatiense TaxID=489973 RepID=A0AA45WWR3_9CLOT|nr:TrkA family potassium uptake protein [Anoxynatronum buryatiense]SMP55157.1 trk system potassium uptake protein TrkA [Anoxynatronum buryatiense]
MKDKYIIIVGCGRLGAHVAKMFTRSRNSLVMIDKDATAFSRLSEEYSGFTIEADAVEQDTLLRAKIDQADVLVATTDDDNTNIMIAQVAREIHHVPEVMLRIYDPSRAKIYEGTGITTICTTLLAAEAFSQALGSQEGVTAP